ncbi:DsrE family protein [Myroides guanonis]|uniref:DsrE/DsrF-like family protein n=1 Tax=Myroides guanonis TaxID=1150112 RepID=A0A1I3U2U5_9FLAO|nr:DsrE family protein [Myroides guanonis]SFJ76087.1 DsrE/DsrF-like family protein [Myroides guanonis]
MIKIKHIAFLLTLNLLPITSMNAQSIEERTLEYPIQKEGKYALLVDKASYLMGAINSGISFKEQSSQIKYEIVLIGPVVKELLTNQELIPLIEKATSYDIKIVVCESAMKKHNLHHQDFHPSIYFTPNGFQYLWGLQDDGFKTIEL